MQKLQCPGFHWEESAKEVGQERLGVGISKGTDKRETSNRKIWRWLLSIEVVGERLLPNVNIG